MFTISRKLFVFIFLLSLVSLRMVGQDEPNMLDIYETVVDFYTKEKLENVRILIEEKKDDDSWEKYAESKTTKKGFINSQLLLQKEYMLTFSKKGYITKKVLINTEMPGRAEAVYEHYNTLLMTSKVETDQDSISLLGKPAIRLYFSTGKYDFSFDSIYKVKVENEIKAIPPEFVKQLIAKIEENSQQDLQDSTALKKQQDDYLALVDQIKEKAVTVPKEDTLAKFNRQKAIKDSIEAVRMAKLNASRDSLLIAKKKAYEDSLALVNKEKSNKDLLEAARLARLKQIQDSLNIANIAKAARLKAIQDSLLAVRKKAQQDAIANANIVKPIAQKIPVPIPVVQKEPELEELVLNKEFNSMFKIQMDTKENPVLAERSERIKKEKIVEKQKVANLGTKYETGNPLTSLLDNVDKYDKALKYKAIQQ